jgi:hypothetical protein
MFLNQAGGTDPTTRSPLDGDITNSSMAVVSIFSDLVVEVLLTTASSSFAAKNREGNVSADFTGLTDAGGELPHHQVVGQPTPSSFGPCDGSIVVRRDCMKRIFFNHNIDRARKVLHQDGIVELHWLETLDGLCELGVRSSDFDRACELLRAAGIVIVKTQ